MEQSQETGDWDVGFPRRYQPRLFLSEIIGGENNISLVAGHLLGVVTHVVRDGGSLSIHFKDDLNGIVHCAFSNATLDAVDRVSAIGQIIAVAMTGPQSTSNTWSEGKKILSLQFTQYCILLGNRKFERWKGWGLRLLI
jgi:hypothetical protein